MQPASPEVVHAVASAAEMRALGARLGRLLAAGDVLALVGPLGSGKTTLAQGLATGLDVPADRHVASPTFALVNQHPGRVPFVHADLYRLAHADELRELGLDEVQPHAAMALEWADRFPDALPGDHLEVTIEIAGDGRRVRLRGRGIRGAELTAAMR